MTQIEEELHEWRQHPLEIENTRLRAELAALREAHRVDGERALNNVNEIVRLGTELDQVTGERDALREAVNATRHESRCRSRAINCYPSEDRKPGPCNCWKAEVRLREMAIREAACDSVAVGGSIAAPQPSAPAPEGWEQR